MKERPTQASQNFAWYLVLSFQTTLAGNVSPPRSKSARSQISAALFYVWTVHVVRAWICTEDMRASCLQAKGRRSYLSQNIGPAVAGSAGLAPLPLLVKYTDSILPTLDAVVGHFIVNF